MGKSGVLEHKSGNISEMRKVEEELLWRAYRNSPKLFRTVPSPTPYGLIFPRLGVSNLHTKNSYRYHLRNGRGYRLHIWPEHSQHPSEQKTIKNLKKRQRGRGLLNFEGTHPPLSQEQVKLRTSNFVRIFVASIGRKAH